MGEEQLALTGSLEVLQDEIDVFKDRIDSASEAELLSFYPLCAAKFIKQFYCRHAKNKIYLSQ